MHHLNVTYGLCYFGFKISAGAKFDYLAFSRASCVISTDKNTVARGGPASSRRYADSAASAILSSVVTAFDVVSVLLSVVIVYSILSGD